MRKSTWIIIGLVVALGLIYVLTKKDEISVGVKSLVLPSFDAQNVSRIEIGGKSPAILIKENDSWFLELGEGDKKRLVTADQSHVKALLQAASDMKVSYYVTELEDKLKSLGFDENAATPISLKSGDKVLWTLVLGNNTTGGARYAKLPEDKAVYVVKTAFWQLVRPNANDWRDRGILKLDEANLRSFSLEKDGQKTLSLTKKDDSSSWELAPETSTPPAFRVNKVALQKIVKNVTTLRASAFLDDENSFVPALDAVLIDKDQKEHRLQFSTINQEKVLVRVPGNTQVFEIPKGIFENINKKPTDLRDLSVMNFDKESIVSISLADKNGRVIVDKKDGKWQLREPKNLPKGFEFDEVAPEDILALSGGLIADDIADPKKDAATNATWLKSALLELSDDKGNTHRLFASPSKHKGNFVVKGNSDDLIYVVPAIRLESLNQGLNAFKKENMALPAMNENTPDFDSLPPDVRQKLMDAMKNQGQHP